MIRDRLAAVRFRDSRGRFISAARWFAWYGVPRDSRGRFKSVSVPRSTAERERAVRSYAATIGWQKRRRSEAARLGWQTRRAREAAEAAWQEHLQRSEAARAGWQTRRAREAAAAAEYSERRARELVAEYEAAAARYGEPAPAFTQRQDAWGLLEIGKVQVDPAASVSIDIQLQGAEVYQFVGRADEFSPMDLRRALDEWSEETLGDEAHYWRAPDLRLWQINRWFAPGTLTASRIEVKTLPEADTLLNQAIGGEIDLPGARLDAMPPELEDADALPE